METGLLKIDHFNFCVTRISALIICYLLKYSNFLDPNSASYANNAIAVTFLIAIDAALSAIVETYSHNIVQAKAIPATVFAVKSSIMLLSPY